MARDRAPLLGLHSPDHRMRVQRGGGGGGLVGGQFCGKTSWWRFPPPRRNLGVPAGAAAHARGPAGLPAQGSLGRKGGVHTHMALLGPTRVVLGWNDGAPTRRRPEARPALGTARVPCPSEYSIDLHVGMCMRQLELGDSQGSGIPPRNFPRRNSPCTTAPPPPPLESEAPGCLTHDGGRCGPVESYPPPPPLYKLRPCPSYSGCRDRINLVPNLIRYKCSAATKDMGLVTNLPVTWGHGHICCECLPT